MRTRESVGTEKLRGGYYTPQPLVADVLDHALDLLGGVTPTRILEPSAGDGAFFEQVSQRFPRARVTGVEIDPLEAMRASAELERVGAPGEVVNDSFLHWSLDQSGYDVIVGNLPFVRFQFISPEDRELADRHALDSGVRIGGVANLWWPMLLASLRCLRIGGVFSLVLPSECLTGVTAGAAREWLLSTVTDLRVDNYPPRSFPGVLQDVVVVSGRRADLSSASAAIRYVEYAADGSRLLTDRLMPATPANWLSLLLSSEEVQVVQEVRDLEAVRPLGEMARFEVAAVTGANAFFSLTDQQVRDQELNQWVVPLLSRMRYAPGLIYTEEDHRVSAESGASTYLFSVKESLDRARWGGLDRYLSVGEAAGLNTRFKTRTREPWYAIPSVRREALLMSKRSHHFPRVSLNVTDAVTTDTIYRGRVTDPVLSGGDIAAVFHNSLTLLTAELEGRSFGGGVLELVPSEVSRLSLPRVPGLEAHLAELDRSARSTDDASAVISATNQLLAAAMPSLSPSKLDRLESIRQRLLARRLSRN